MKEKWKSEYHKKYYEKNKEELKIKGRKHAEKYRESHKEQIAKKQRDRYKDEFNREKACLYQREYRKRNGEKIRGCEREHYYKLKISGTLPKKNVESVERRKWKDLENNYGITKETYELMFKSQGGRCKICGIHQGKLSKKLSVDHCHETGKVRGLLCNFCNIGVGMFKDNQDILKKAVIYLNY